MFLRINTSRTRLYLTPRDLLEAAITYFEWCEAHPLKEAKTFAYKGEIVKARENKVRVFTDRGLASYLGLTLAKLRAHRLLGDDWSEVVDLIDQVIYTQKFENAAAGLLNAGLIARDLGIAERTELTGRDGGPIQTEDTIRDAEAFLEKLSKLTPRPNE